MKILSLPPEVKPWEYFCENCGSFLRAEESDIRKFTSSDPHRLALIATGVAYGVQCPVCKYRTPAPSMTKYWTQTHDVPFFS